MEENINFNEKKQMTDLVNFFKEVFKKLSKMFNLFEEVKAKDKDALEKFEMAVKSLSSLDSLTRALEENISYANEFIKQAKSIRIQNFKRYEAEYIQDLRIKGKKIREYSSGWRIDKLKIETKPEIAKIRLLYNDQVLIDWSSVNSKDDFIDLENQADDMLMKQIIPQKLLINIFSEAFNQATIPKRKSSLIPMLDFYKEVRIALIRNCLVKKPTSKIDKYLDFPLWAFLYNLDIYRSLEIPIEQKLGFQTGSQVESSKGLVINGLNPQDDYKVMCYVIPPCGGINK